MRAFVKTTKGTFPNVNFYLAWEAFNTLGYSVTCFEEEDIGSLDITPATPVFAGVKIFRQIIDKLGIDYPPFDCYPDVLKPYYGRNLRRSTLGVEREKFHKDGVPVFVKPVLPKQFLGHVWNSIINLIPLANVPDDAEVWVCEPMDIHSEFRVYVNSGEILGVKHYYGDWSKVPNKAWVKEVVQNYLLMGSPIAYGVDIGIANSGKEFVIEVNDGCNLGNYGLDSIHYGEMIVSRWFEIMGSHAAREGIKKEIEEFKDNPYAQKSGLMCNFMSRNYRDMMTRIESQKGREKSMAVFADEVKKRLREENVDIGIPEVNLQVGSKPLVTGYMKYQIGSFRIDRDEYWFLTDAERQALHDKHDPGSRAIPFDPQFAEKYGKNPNGPF